MLDVPSIRFEALLNIFGEGQICAAVDGDLVVVVQIDELTEAEMPGKRSGLMRDAFHQIAVGDNRVGKVIDDGEVFGIELGGEVLLGNGHADAVSKTLAEGSCGRLDPWRDEVLRMARRLTPPLAEVLQLVQRQVIPGQMQQGIEQHRAMACRKNKAIPVEPRGIVGVMAEKPGPERIGHRGCSHRQSGMAAVRPLHTIHCEEANGVDGEGVKVCLCEGIRLGNNAHRIVIALRWMR